ncbi:MAG: VRR-NUC domain-containing protein [Thiohalorhabdus sp.]
MGHRETPLMRNVQLELGGREGIKLFRNDIGTGYQGKAYNYAGGGVVIPNPRRVSYGLHPGSPDLVGWRSIEITPDMVGATVAVFVGVETKAKGGRVQPNQRNFLETLQQGGGLAGVARSVDEAVEIVAPDGRPARTG